MPSKISGVKYESDNDVGVYIRLLPTISGYLFSITDGQLPSNVKAGYVIRRILMCRRYGYVLGMHEPFLCKLVPQLVSDMGEAFPELAKQQSLIVNVIREEKMHSAHSTRYS